MNGWDALILLGFFCLMAWKRWLDHKDDER
ncbi:hypothetical protein DFP86_102279 [Paludibacterium purpuratum]|uniref:Uncharacterized protein n=1 Tax=Paludibacterium purpuratum TaxID=1144873 RepID=A0A4R7BDU7_9NEIS|nr:hypothetical protein DFP86_102279 [Paludibacterium purpuratum]